MGTPVPRDQRMGAVPHRQWHQGPQDLLEPLERRAAHPLPSQTRPPRPQLEVLGQRHEGTPVLGRLPAGLLRRRRTGVLSNTNTEWAPWYVIPADHKWFARICVGAVLTHTLIELDPQFPKVTPEPHRPLPAAT